MGGCFRCETCGPSLRIDPFDQATRRPTPVVPPTVGRPTKHDSTHDSPRKRSPFQFDFPRCRNLGHSTSCVTDFYYGTTGKHLASYPLVRTYLPVAGGGRSYRLRRCLRSRRLLRPSARVRGRGTVTLAGLLLLSERRRVEYLSLTYMLRITFLFPNINDDSSLASIGPRQIQNNYSCGRQTGAIHDHRRLFFIVSEVLFLVALFRAFAASSIT